MSSTRPQKMDVDGEEEGDQLFRLLAAVRTEHDVQRLAAFLARDGCAIAKDVRIHGLTVFHACLLATRGTVDGSAARAIVDAMKTLHRDGFVWERRSGRSHVPDESWFGGRVAVKDTTVAECAAAFARQGKDGMATYGQALPAVVKFVLAKDKARSRDLAAEQQRSAPQGTRSRGSGRRKGAHPRAQAQVQVTRESQEELTVETQLFVQVLQDTFSTLDTFAAVAGQLQGRARRTMTNSAAQTVSLVGAHAAELKRQGNDVALGVGRARLDEFERRYERDDRAWHMLEPFFAYLEDATEGKPTRELPVMGDLAWTQQGVSGALSAVQGASHRVGSVVADARARSAELAREHRREARRPLRPGRRHVNQARNTDEALFSTTGVYQREHAHYAVDPAAARDAMERHPAGLNARVWGA